MSAIEANVAIGCIDHVVIVVGDLEASAETYRRLGFTLSPKGVHSAALGSANHTIMLQRDYFELLTVIAPTERNGRWRDAIAAGGGIEGVALTTEDAAAAREIWQAKGLAADELIRFSRAVTRPAGPDLEARFEVVALADLPETGVRVFVCSQPTREAVWLPELMTHANTARAIAGLTVVSSDPEATARMWERIVPGLKVATSAGGVTLETGPNRIALVTPATARQRFGVTVPARRTRAVGIDYRVASLEACRAALRANGVPHTEAAGTIVVAPDAACNVRIGFSE